MTLLYLIVAILFEAGWAIAMKMSDGLRKPAPAAAMIAMYLASVVFLALATKKMDVGVGYAVWAGTGAVLVAAAGVLYFKEPVTALKVVSILLIVGGIVGLGAGGTGKLAP